MRQATGHKGGAEQKTTAQGKPQINPKKKLFEISNDKFQNQFIDKKWVFYGFTLQLQQFPLH